MKTLHLVCNAHLDPVWLWEWEEGAAEALSTFRVAADLCEQFDGFIFNHNEVILYQWVEEYEPALFARIQRLVTAGKWHIMGGWYLQPDCNMPSGESFVRQILIGQGYFQEKFGVMPTTAINFDPFGHTRGLVQILAKAGYHAYLFCRPHTNADCPLPAEDFTWVGYDGSTVLAHRASEHYASSYGKAVERVRGWLQNHDGDELGVLLWGVGNHGGGPSRIDLHNLTALLGEPTGWEIIHSTPEQYFAALGSSAAPLPRHAGDINSWGAGCYTSQIRLKQKHRLLENELYAVEKMAAHAAQAGLASYPADAIHAAQADLLMTEFHDILPGSSIQPVEEMALRVFDHGLEILSRLKARAFFALASGQPAAQEGTIPVLVYNPHPYPLTTQVECEFNMADYSWDDSFTVPRIMASGVELPGQLEKEHANHAVEWRKRLVFQATLQPGQMNRFDCQMETLPARPTRKSAPVDGRFTVVTDELEVTINADTGLMDRYRVRGVDYLQPGAFRPLVMADNADPWGMLSDRFPNVKGAFALMTPEESAWLSGVKSPTLAPVRVIEDGTVRTVIEATLGYGHSSLVIQYKIPKQGSEVEVALRVVWAEKDTMLKLAIPTVWGDAQYRGQVAYGRESFPTDGKEVVAQQWVAAVTEAGTLSVINDGIYGSDMHEGEIRLSLLRSPAYAAHPWGETIPIQPDRYTVRMEQGERQYRFWINAGATAERLDAVEREAQVWNQRPMALSFFPSGAGERPLPLVRVTDDVVTLTAYKAAEDGSGYIIRLFEPTGAARNTTLEIPAFDLRHPVALGPYALVTLKIDPGTKCVTEVDLLERALDAVRP